MLFNYLKININNFQDKFKEFNYNKKHIFLFSNSVFFHKIFDKEIKNADINYIKYIYSEIFNNI